MKEQNGYSPFYVLTVIIWHQKCKIGFLRTKIEFLKKLAEISIFNRVAKIKKNMRWFPWMELAENW